jgi:hypothetical protein
MRALEDVWAMVLSLEESCKQTANGRKGFSLQNQWFTGFPSPDTLTESLGVLCGRRRAYLKDRFFTPDSGLIGDVFGLDNLISPAWAREIGVLSQRFTLPRRERLRLNFLRCFWQLIDSKALICT